MSGIHVRRGTPADLAAIVALERAAPEAPHWPEAIYATILGDTGGNLSRRVLLVAGTDQEIAGFAVGLAGAGDVSELESVVVAASARRTGIGRALCCAVLEWCRSCESTAVVLEVRAASAGAIVLYTGLGFVPAGRRSNYYRDPDDDALVLRIELV